MTTKKAKAAKREHKSGKTNGYGFDTDGEHYWIAPCYTDQMDGFIDAANGLAVFLAAFNDDFTKRHTVIAKERRRWWDTVCADLGINSAGDWVYSQGKISPKPKPEAQP